MITVGQIAEKCGVSQMTVCRALNDKQKEKVSVPLRRKIRSIANEHGYRPSNISRALSTGKTYLIGYICEHLRHFASEIFSAALEKMAPDGYDMLALEWEQVLDRKKLLKSVVDRRVEGVLAFPDRRNNVDEHLLELVNYGIPVVLIDRVLNTKSIQQQFGFVGPDNHNASRLAVEHLVGLGHKKIGFAARMEDAAYSTTNQRYQAYQQAMMNNDLTPQEMIIVDNPDLQQSGGQLTERFLGDNITAVVADNDVVASKVMARAFSCGLKVPDDVSVVGMGNIEPFVGSLYPGLTTVDLGAHRIGCTAVQLLLKLIEDKNKSTGEPVEQITVPVSLEVRESTGLANF
jgi:DNA-binding LacI/PurR family transcriptional regulator